MKKAKAQQLPHDIELSMEILFIRVKYYYSCEKLSLINEREEITF